MERRLAAILAADVVGYSRLMGADEVGTLARLKSLQNELVQPQIAAHKGRIVKLMGDGLLAEFPSVVEAVQCAVDLQTALAGHESGLPDSQRLHLRIGINLGDVIVEGTDIYGDGVNVAARLEGLAEPGGICVRRNVRNQVRDKLDLSFEDMGEVEVKNIARPVRVFRVVLGGETPAVSGPAAPVPARAAGFKRWPVAIASIAVLAAVGAFGLWQAGSDREAPQAAGEAALPLSDKPSIAVLPFANLSSDSQQDYFADGMTDDLITDLSKLSGLFVISRNSVFTYKGKAVNVPDVARELGVRYVLEGSVRRAGETVRINAQLIDGRTGSHLWAERYDRQYGDIFTIQDQVIERIVKALSVQLTETERAEVGRLPTANLEAYDYYLRGEKLAYRADPDSVREALRFYQKAIALDPGFADAYAGYARTAADVLTFAFTGSLPSAVARKRAYEAASRALSLDPGLARSYSVLALLQMLEGEHENAIASARKAVDLSPNNAEAHLNLAVVLVYAGRQEEALGEMERVLQLNPKPPSYVYDYYALALYMNGRDAEALAALTQGQGEEKSDLHLEILAATNARLGHRDAAKSAVETLLAQYPDLSLAWYRVLLAHHARVEDLEARLDGLRLAGLPEWPYGYRGDPALRLTATDIDKLIDGRTWVGQRVGIGSFMQYMQPSGDYVERGSGYQLVGKVFRQGDSLCFQSPTIVLGRQHCGPVYRNPEGAPERQDDYIHPDAYALKKFSLGP